MRFQEQFTADRELLEEALRGGERVIDVGTGSGILAIGAALLGLQAQGR